jgi:crotonobetainyl-CoA:carnitine CoA-transferase CaiB-like acyl-CoA transferase
VLYDDRDKIHGIIEAITITKNTQDWLDIMLELDLWVSEVNDQKDVENDPQVIHNNTFIEVDHPKAGKVKVTNVPFTMSETPGKINRSSPLIGEHGNEILKEIGYDDQSIESLLNRNVISIEKV